MSLYVDGSSAPSSSPPDPAEAACRGLIAMARDLIIPMENPKPSKPKAMVFMDCFLNVMLKFAPEDTCNYVINSILMMNGDPDSLQMQASIWFNHFIISGMWPYQSSLINSFLATNSEGVG
jgi:hypothetical protein